MPCQAALRSLIVLGNKMHIEPGYLSAAKIALANTAAIALAGSQLIHLVRQPRLAVRVLLAALFFSLCMQLVHVPVGPSELHLLGAMPIYLTLGLLPALLGFGLGLLLQGLLFEPADLVHLGVNFLSLALPLLAVHAAFGRRLRRVDPRTLLKLDAAFYGGVTLMVGFWLALGETATPLAAWAGFAASYASVAIAEPLLTWLALRGVARVAGRPLGRLCFDTRFCSAA
jgi:ABC-type Co2+ transport system permease subunit